MKNKINKSIVVMSASILSIPSIAVADNKDEKPMNVLFIAVDDLRPELGCYGRDVISPNIDTLAQKGIRFERAYCNIPVSGASRASLLTGIRPNKDRFLTYETWAEKDASATISLPAWLKKHEYTTISNGKIFHHQFDCKDSWSENWRGTSSGNNWQDYLDDENLELQIKKGGGSPFEIMDVSDDQYLDGMTANKTVEDIKKLAKSGERFFLSVGFLKPHLPFNPPQKYWDMYPVNEITLPENYKSDNKMFPEVAFSAQHYWSELRNYSGVPKKGPLSDEQAAQMIRGYKASVSYMDAMVGKVLKALEDNGLSDNTVIILFGDHGWLLGEHGMWCKHSNFSPALNAPLIIYSPKLKGNTTINSIVEFIDIYPTICELTDVEKPAHLDGTSMLKLMQGVDKDWKNYAISKYQDGTTIVVDQYFYTQWIKRSNGSLLGEMCFDHQMDPNENNNLAVVNKNGWLIRLLKNKLEEKRGFSYK